MRIWADAVAFYGAGTNEQLQSVVDAIGKMYSKGTVEADQLDRLFDAGIGAAEIYAQAVGQSVSSVKDDLSAGNISAAQFLDTVSKAMDAGVSSGAAKDAGATWATTFANMQAAMSRGWVDVIEGLDAALASRGLPSSMEMVASFGAKIESMLTRIGGSTGAVVDVAVIVVDVLGAAFNAIGAVGGFIADNWSIIVPLILGVVAALIVYNATMGVAWLTTLKDLAVKGAHAIASAAETAAIIGLTIAQEGFNAALAMCPLTWIIIIIIAIIAIILAVIVAINKAQGKTVSAVGIIVGALAAAGAFIWNLVASLVNMAIGGFAALWNFLGGFANFFANFLRDPLGAAAHLIASFCTTALNLLSALAQAVDTLFGTDLVSSVNGWIDRVNGWADTVGNGKYQEEVQTINPADYYIDRKSYSGAYKWGYGKGSSAGGKIKDMFGGKDAASAAGSSIPSSLTNGVGNIDKNTDKIKDSVQSSSEDLKLLRELAERQAINKYTTASITVDMKGMTNQITSDRDIDGVINVMTKKLENALIVSAEGVHT